MQRDRISRRSFLRGTTLLAGASVVSPILARGADGEPRRTAADRVPLGKTGLEISRVGIGTGSQSGRIQRALGREGFNRLIRHAYERGITYIDAAQSYETHGWIRDAIKGIPREKLFLQTKMPGTPEKPLEVLEGYLKEFGVEYIDSLLVHCAFTKGWDEERKRILDAFVVAKEKKLIRAKGVSCHSLPALRRAVELDWTDVHLVRLNPQGAHVDTPVEKVESPSDASHVPAVLAAIRASREKGRGIIGMKIIGNGDFTRAEDREKSIRFAVGCGLLDSMVIGFKSVEEVDEAIRRVDAALAEVGG